jgi:Xaa-Pro dipeptidase
MHSSAQSYSSTAEIKVTGGGIAKYNAKAHARRVAEAAGSPSALVVLQGEKKVNYSGSDQPRHFRQDRYFYYITGCNEPDCYVTYDISKDFLTLWLPQGDPSRVFYDGRGSTPEEAMAKYDIDDAKYIVPDIAGKSTQVTIETFLLSRSASQNRWPQVLSADVLRPAMDVCRAVKDHEEIELIREANRISSEAHRQVLKQLSHLKTETQAEGLFLNACISEGAKEQAYGPIMGSGPNAGILHYIANNEAFDDRQVLLIDASCEWQLYAADITRTMPLNRKKPGYWPSKEAEAVYKAVEKVQEACIKMLKPDIYFIDVSRHAIHMTIDALLELGVLEGDHDEIFRQGTDGAFFPHGLGHHIGLEVHDLTPTRREHSNEASTSNTRDGAERFSLNRPTVSGGAFPDHSLPLEPGNVVTVEPGIYFNKFMLDNVYLSDPGHRKFINLEALERYMPVGGVRIEDDILITKDGYENLTPAVKGEEMLAVIRG